MDFSARQALLVQIEILFVTNIGLSMYKDMGKDEYYGQTLHLYTWGHPLPVPAQ